MSNTELRAAAQRALAWLEKAEPFTVDEAISEESAIADALRAALAKPAATAQQVPAAWRYKDSSRICDNSDGRMNAGPGWVPLYTAPRA